MSFAYDGGQRAHSSGAGSRHDDKPRDWTPADLAEHAKNTAGNVTRSANEVTAACARMQAATAPAAQAAAKQEATLALESLRTAAAAAEAAIGQTTDPAVAAVLTRAKEQLKAAEQQIAAAEASAPAASAEAAAPSSPGLASFMDALPPEGGPRPRESQALLDKMVAALAPLEFDDIDPLVRELSATEPTTAHGRRAQLLGAGLRQVLVKTLTSTQFRQKRLLERGRRRPAAAAHTIEPPSSPVAAAADVHGLGSGPPSPAVDADDPVHALANRARAVLGIEPRLLSGEAGRAPTEARGAHGVAHGDMIAIHPDVDATTPAGKQVVLHEMVHQAQAQLPADQDVGRDAAEAEAEQLATAAASGAPLQRPSLAITLATPAADRDGKGKSKSTPPAGASPSSDLAPSVNYEALPGSLSVVVRSSWLASGDLSARLRTLLMHLRERGILHWATPAALAAAAQATAAAQPGLAAASEHETFTVHFTSSIFNFTGLPPGVPAMVTGYAGALTVTATMPGLDVEPGTVTALSLAQLTQLVDAMETFTGLEVRPEARAGLAKVRTEGFGGHGVLTFRFAEDALEQLFGKDAYQDWVGEHTGGKGKDKAKSVAKGLDFAGSVSGLTPLELAFVRAWLKQHLDVRDGVGGHLDRDVRELITQIEQSPHRDQIIATLRQGRGGEGVTSVALRHAINAATFEAEAKQHQIALPTDHAKLDPVWAIPVPARIDQRAGQITANERVPFFLQVDVPPGLMSQEQADALRFRPFVNSIDWVFEKIEGQRDAAPPPRAVAALMHSLSGGKHTMHQQYTGVAPQPVDVSFYLPPREQRAVWRVTALVRHSHFEPAALHTEVEVKSEDRLMHELRQDVVNDMGSVTGTDYDFDTGLLNNRLPKPGTDIGTIFRGELPDDWKPTTGEERNASREAEMKNLQDMIAHLREHNPGGDNAAAIAAAERYLAQLKEADQAIDGEAADGWRAFELKGTLMSDEPGVADGQLDLYGSARPRARVKKPRGNRDSVAEPKAVEDGVVVHIRDLSRRFDSDARMFTGEGADFESALAAAFVDLCQAYPPGKVFVLAQSPGDRGRDQTRQTVGFELRTGSRGKEIKADVWDPAVNMVVNAAAMATMIFVPGSGAVIMPALMVYNGLGTVDDLHTKWVEGRLDATDLEIGLAQIGLDLLPYLGRAQMIAGSRKALYVLRGLDIAGEAVVMTAAGLHQAHELQVNEVAAMAGLYEQMVELERSSHPSDPRLAGLRAQFEARAKEVRKATVRAFTQMAAQRAFFIGAKHLIHGANQLMAPLETMRQAGGIVEVAGEQLRYDRAKGRIVGDPKLLDEATLARLLEEQRLHMSTLALQAAEDLGVEAFKTEVVLGDEISVAFEPGRVRLGYSPSVTPDEARAMWKAQAEAARGGGGGRVPVPEGEPATGRGKSPARNGEERPDAQPVRHGPDAGPETERPLAREPAGSAQAPAIEQLDPQQYRPAPARPIDGSMPKLVLVDGSTGRHFLFKPNRQDAPLPYRAVAADITPETIASRAKAAEVVADEIGIDTPEIRIVRYNGEVGSLQEWRSGKNRYSLAKLESTHPELYARVVASPEYARLRSEVDTFDFALNNLDRNKGNLLVTLDDAGRVVELTGIDHDLTFTRTKERFVDELGIWTQGLPERYSKPLVDKLRAIAAAPEAFRQKLGQHLDPQEIQSALDRIDTILSDVDSKLATRGAAGTFFGDVDGEANQAAKAPPELFATRPPLEKTFEHALNPQAYLDDVVKHYGINLRGVKAIYDPTLETGKLGVTRASEGGMVIRIGRDAFVDEPTLANTIAHELSHARDYQRGAHKEHGDASSMGDGTVYGAGNALERMIRKALGGDQ